MEKNNQKKKQRERRCEKILRAISISSPIQAIRRISNVSRIPSPAKPRSSNPKPNSLFRTIDVQTKPISKPAGESVQINFDYSMTSVTNTHGHGSKKPNSALGAKLSASKAEPPKTHVKKLESKKSLGGMQIEERFTNYINQAKLKIRAMTNVEDVMETETSEAEGTDTKDGHKDQFSEYIKRAKMKIRMSSSAGSLSRRIESSKYLKD